MRRYFLNLKLRFKRTMHFSLLFIISVSGNCHQSAKYDVDSRLITKTCWAAVCIKNSCKTLLISTLLQKAFIHLSIIANYVILNVKCYSDLALASSYYYPSHSKIIYICHLYTLLYPRKITTYSQKTYRHVMATISYFFYTFLLCKYKHVFKPICPTLMERYSTLTLLYKHIH